MSGRHGLDVLTRGLVHIYRAEGHDVAALSGVDLHVRAGDVVGLLGPSGSGKSTLLSLFAGLMRPSAGSIRVGEKEIGKLNERELDDFRAAEVGILLQGASRNLLPYLTPRGNVEFAQRSDRGGGASPWQAGEVLELMGLGDVADHALAGLTPGQLQLTALGVAMAARPGLLLADEPTSQLDHVSRDLVLDTVHRVNREQGTTVVVVTHDPDVAARLPRTITIRDGRIGGEGREGMDYAVVAPDGSLPLPPAAIDAFPPGALVRVHEVDGVWKLELEGGS
ncbi:MAG: ATP-binding cassette domain-containing protein [Micrococcales bacterium]|nr:ATP-binding cassette domain-containing protein [Micrococcales bacterium]